MPSLIRTDTNEAVVALGALDDGRVLTQRVSNGTLDVITIDQLQVVQDQSDGAQ